MPARNDHNRKALEPMRKDLRTNGTPAEGALWKLISRRKLQGRKFRRQFSINNCILDFYCVEEKLCIELDGAPHFTDEGKQRDEKRDAFLRSRGITIIRIENKAVFERTSDVLALIQSHFNNG